MVGAIAVEVDFIWVRKEALVEIGYEGHDFVGEFSLEQFEEATDFSGATFFKIGPVFRWELINIDFDFVEFGAADEGVDASGLDFKVAD